MHHVSESALSVFSFVSSSCPSSFPFHYHHPCPSFTMSIIIFNDIELQARFDTSFVTSSVSGIVASKLLITELNGINVSTCPFGDSNVVSCVLNFKLLEQQLEPCVLGVDYFTF